MAALDATTALAAVKRRLGIPLATTTWDTDIADYIVQAVNRLWPKAAYEVASQDKAITVDSYGEATVDMSSLSTPVSDARSVEISDGNGWWPASKIYRHGVTLRLRGLKTSDTTARIYGLKPYTIAQVPEDLQLAVFWFAMAEFYDYLAGNKSKYTIYVQQTGARAVDNMRDEASFFEAKAEAHVDEHSTIYGSQ